MTLNDATGAGQAMLHQLNIARMRARFLPARHPSVQQAIFEALRVLRTVLNASGEISLIMRAGEFYLNGRRLPKESLQFAPLLQDLRRNGIHAVQFMPGLSRDEMTRFIEACFVPNELGASAPSGLARLQEHPLEHIRLNQADLVLDLAVPKSVLEAPLSRAKDIYKSAIRAAVESHFDAMHGTRLNVQFTLAVVDMLQQGLATNPDIYFALGQLREFSEYTYYHSVNVALISMLLGKGIGLDREAIVRLGAAAMLHDVGKICIPREILDKPGRLDDKERAIIEAHPLDSVRILLDQRDIAPAALAVAAQHHARYDFTGYPDLNGTETMHLFSYIVAIADVYDALRSARSYKPAMLPDKAMEIMIQGAGSQFHPVLLKAFFRMVGFYPVGSAVELNTGELAVVVGANPLAPLAPKIRITAAPEKDVLERSINLNEPTSFGEQPRSILRAIDPAAHGIRVADYLV